ncbi:hypothetical protein BH09VER1_BH09VER1_27150 [soil metagenome]
MSKGPDDATRLQRTTALVVAGLVLYVPANILPVMTITITGQVEPLTVMGGVQELYDSGLAPIAAIVFIASVFIPFAKLASLCWLLMMQNKPEYRRQRTGLRRIIHKIGSWSMIDVFLLSILVAVGQLGILASVQAEPGAIFFAATLICTIVATEIYEPRLIWRSKETTAA